jgi:hypothetical protein
VVCWLVDNGVKSCGLLVGRDWGVVFWGVGW